MSRWTTFCLSCCAAWALATSPASATTVAVGAFTPSTAAPFIVPIVVSGAANLNAFLFDIAYDPGAYTIATGCDPFSDAYCDFVTGPVTPGGFYADPSFPALFTPGFILLDALGAQTGQLLAVSGAWQDFVAAPSGDGILAYIEFIAMPGTTAGSPIVVTAVSLSDVPEPATGLLILAALLSLAIKRRRARAPARTNSSPVVLGRSHLMKHCRPVLARLAGVALSLAASTAGAQSVVNGPYYATPSWDQTMPASTRFLVLANFNSEAVLDRETGLVWQRAAGDAGYAASASSNCHKSRVGGRYGWRLPTASEMTSLFDPSVGVVPSLSIGHPFTGFVDPTQASLWTATVDLYDPGQVGARGLVVVNSATAGQSAVYASSVQFSSTARAQFLCVRGGGGGGDY